MNAWQFFFYWSVMPCLPAWIRTSQWERKQWVEFQFRISCIVFHGNTSIFMKIIYKFNLFVTIKSIFFFFNILVLWSKNVQLNIQKTNNTAFIFFCMVWQLYYYDIIIDSMRFVTRIRASTSRSIFFCVIVKGSPLWYEYFRQ